MTADTYVALSIFVCLLSVWGAIEWALRLDERERERLRRKRALEDISRTLEKKL